MLQSSTLTEDLSNPWGDLSLLEPQVPEAQAVFEDYKAGAYTQDDKYVITSPNMGFIPEPCPVPVKVSLRADFRYGLVDPIQWPQLLASKYEFLCAILRQVPPDDSLAPLWWTPKENDFILLPDSDFKTLGLLSKPVLEPLQSLIRELSQKTAGRNPRPGSRLARFESSMRLACDRLSHFPCTFRDAVCQVREAQRYYLMTHAFIEFYDKIEPAATGSPSPVNPRLMGAFSGDPAVVQKMYLAGVPVWFIRSKVSLRGEDLKNVHLLSPPKSICTVYGPGQGHVIYRGMPGPEHLMATARGGHTYQDVSFAPILAVYDDQGYQPPAPQSHYRNAVTGVQTEIAALGAPFMSTAGALGAATTPMTNNYNTPAATVPLASIPSNAIPTASASSSGRLPRTNVSMRRVEHGPYMPATAHRSQVRGRNKFEPFKHPWMPRPAAPWSDAMSRVDLSRPARPSREIWGHWLPEPALLVGPKSDERRDKYFMSWLRLRPAWIYLLRQPRSRVTGVPTQWWRDILLGSNHKRAGTATATSERWEKIKLVFGDVFEEVEWDGTGSCAHWFGDRLQTLKHDLCPLILWELSELAFRHELIALDRFLVPYRLEPWREAEREDMISQIFPDRTAHAPPELPKEARGLVDCLPHRRVASLRALQRVLVRWPRCPPAAVVEQVVHNMREEEILTIEKELAYFYVTTFFEQSGRAPMVPHIPPPLPEPVCGGEMDSDMSISD